MARAARGGGAACSASPPGARRGARPAGRGEPDGHRGQGGVHRDPDGCRGGVRRDGQADPGPPLPGEAGQGARGGLPAAGGPAGQDDRAGLPAAGGQRGQDAPLLLHGHRGRGRARPPSATSAGLPVRPGPRAARAAARLDGSRAGPDARRPPAARSADRDGVAARVRPRGPCGRPLHRAGRLCLVLEISVSSVFSVLFYLSSPSTSRCTRGASSGRRRSTSARRSRIRWRRDRWCRTIASLRKVPACFSMSPRWRCL